MKHTCLSFDLQFLPDWLNSISLTLQIMILWKKNIIDFSILSHRSDSWVILNQVESSSEEKVYKSPRWFFRYIFVYICQAKYFWWHFSLIFKRLFMSFVIFQHQLIKKGEFSLEKSISGGKKMLYRLF